MTSRERVYAALRREPVDRVPIYMWIHPDTVRRLGRLLEIPPDKVSTVMGDDVRQTWVNNNWAMEGIVHEKDGEGHTDLWGIRWVKDGPFNQIADFPLANASREEALRYTYPYEHLEQLMAPMASLAQQAGTEFLGCDISPCVFEMTWRLTGMEWTLTEMAADPDLLQELFRRAADFSVLLGETACARFALDWLWLGDDLAGQQSTMMSPALWREMVKPQLERCAQVGKRRGLFVAFHSCGAIRPVISDLIEIGIDVLNPIQCKCPGMDPLELKREYGQSLTYMGGVDTQDLLPNGTAAEVLRSTERLIEGMTADGGGYILAASHAIPPETPDDNIFALYQAAGVSRAEMFDRAAGLRANHKAGLR